MVHIRDPIHGTINLSALEGKILDSPPMQRLRGVRQLAMAYLVYPGANHTRFEHSIGTLHLADKMARGLNLPQGQLEELRLAALLHDVGHTAFSHEAEYVLSPHIGDHEKIGERLVESSPLSDIISENFSPRKISSLYRSPVGEIITSDIGADRMDYLLRDSHYTGVAYGIVDSDRICASVSMGSRGLSLLERGLEAAESLLVARFTMFSTVYLHKTVRIASRMLQQSLLLAIEDGTLQPKKSANLSDAQMLDLLASSKKGGQYARLLTERKLFKKACSLPVGRVKKVEETEKLLSEKCGCAVLLDVPRLSLETKINLQSEDGKSSPLSSASELVSSLQKMQRGRLDVLVICEEKYAKKVAEAAKKLLG